MRKRIAASSVLVALLALAVLNGVAWMHARAMMRFDDSAVRTAAPEELGVLAKTKVLVTGVRVPRPRNTQSPLDLGIEHETVTIETASGASLEAWVLPQADSAGTALLFHGYAGAKDRLLPVAESFWARGFTVVMIDFQGSGGSSGSRTTLSVREADDVRAVLVWADAYDVPEPLVGYGFSMGGAALLRASRDDDLGLDALVVEATFDRLSTTVGHRFENMGLPTFPGTQLLLFWGSIEVGANAFAVAPVEDARSVRVPTLVLGGADDTRVNSQESESIALALPAGRHHLFSGVGHELAVAAARAEWDRELDSFLEDVLGLDWRECGLSW